MRKTLEKHWLDHCLAVQQTQELIRSRLFQNKTFLHNPGKRSDLFVYEKNSQPTPELITEGDLPLRIVLFTVSGLKPVLTPIASCQESAGTAQGQDLC